MKIKLVTDQEAILFVYKHNPLLLRDPIGDLCFYNTYSDCYFDFFGRFYIYAPKGYFDPVLWLVDWYGMTLANASRTFNNLRVRAKRVYGPYYLNLRDNEEMLTNLRFFVGCVHFLTETKFRSDQFELAFKRFSESFLSVTNSENDN